MKEAACIRLLSAVNALHPSVLPSQSAPNVPAVPIVPFKRVIVPSYDEKRGDLIFFSPSLLANRASSARIRHFRQQAFPGRLQPCFQFLGGLRLFFPFLSRHGLSGESLRQNQCQFSFHFHSILFRVCSLRQRGAFRKNPFRPRGERRLLTVSSKFSPIEKNNSLSYLIQ